MSKHVAFRYEYHGLARQLLSDVEIISRTDGKRVTCKGVWDTGAMFTMITPYVSNALKLIPIDTISISGVGGKTEKAPVVMGRHDTSE
ncbi:MAG: hypothetical protein Ta2A_18120 [Treponemataceae bacterium]|nr:MAG: hypothetical protein Ta2A_18120 [Treponemataceae bacterium]